MQLYHMTRTYHRDIPQWARFKGREITPQANVELHLADDFDPHGGRASNLSGSILGHPVVGSGDHADEAFPRRQGQRFDAPQVVSLRRDAAFLRNYLKAVCQ